jgi:hypothetical protein
MRTSSCLGVSCLALLGAAFTAACSSDATPPNSTDSSTQAVASVMGGADLDIDAPWRLEPIGADVDALSNIYPPIPIVVSVSDASMQDDPETKIPFGKFCGVNVHEYWADGQQHVDPLAPQSEDVVYWHLDTWIPANSSLVREIERSDKWPYSSDVAANHRVCRQWKGESCAQNLDVGSTAEWHATVAYKPQQMASGGTRASWLVPVRNGDDVVITVTAKFARAGGTCDTNTLGFSDTLSVHLGEALPRFSDSNWVYGDVHYHGQGTDNEGENGYAYRPTLQAMRAMGLDFLFATDHASDSGQVTDLDPIFIDQLPDVPWPLNYVEDWAAETVNDKLKGFDILSTVEAARDMNTQRWQAMRTWLNDTPESANADVVRAMDGGRFAPRMFVGGEVDIVPEISTTERNTGLLAYGNGHFYDWRSACWSIPDALLTLGKYTTADTCPNGPQADLTDVASEGGRYLVKDIDGLLERWYARQHMVYLPTDGTNVNGFVSSRTTTYGGGSQRLKDLLTPTYWNTMIGKGYGFLAHPVSATSGSDPSRLGPDMIPYSDVQLRTAFESPAMLGLELWNEDSRVETTPGAYAFPYSGFVYQDTVTRPYEKWYGMQPKDEYRDLHDGLFQWDKMLQWGLRPSQTASLSWLPPGSPRRVFMSGGSDAHGDWNYRRVGSITGTSAIVDTAIGKPRNLVNVHGAGAESALDASGVGVPQLGQKQVTDALASGEFSITDGPALRIAIDNNNNGLIDAGDTPMGGIGNWNSTSTVPIVVEWKSTTEFNPVTSIDLYVGVASSGTDLSLVYAPVLPAPYHGVHSVGTPTGALDPTNFKDVAGGAHHRLFDNYMADASGLLHITPQSSDYVFGGSPYWGRRKIVLSAASFPVGKVTTTPGPEVCRPNAYCNKPGFEDRCDYICTDGPSTYTFDSMGTPDRMYVRAFARTQVLAGCGQDPPSAATLDAGRRGKCTERLAFTNPVWITPRTIAWRPPTPVGAAP